MHTPDDRPRARHRKPYTAPRLSAYGDVRTLTLTEVEANPMNDMFGNFKTV